MVNAYILYRKFCPSEKKLDHYEFRMSVCKSLIAEAPNAPHPSASAGRKLSVEKPGRLTERHFPDLIPPVPGAKRQRPCRDCKACNPSKRNRHGFKRKQTSFWCPECEVPLCVPECFRVYHTVLHYNAVLLPGSVESSDSE